VPSGITHILLTKELQNGNLDQDMKNILADGEAFLTIGAVAPDLPYGSIADFDTFLLRQSGMANNFHYLKTNQIPLQSLQILKSLKDKTDEEVFFQMFTFFLGYISHVVADGIIHPYIRDHVGDYKTHKTEHRALELKLDVLYFSFLRKNTGDLSELMFSEIQKELLNYKSSLRWKETFQLYSHLISDVYGGIDTIGNISDWIQGLENMFSLASSDYPDIIRGQLTDSIIYQKANSIETTDVLFLTKPVFDRDNTFCYRDKVDYFNDCIPRFFTKFEPIVQNAYNFVFNGGPPFTENDIPAIDLDTGRLLSVHNNLDIVPEFWK
jgi:hypothetical protein